MITSNQIVAGLNIQLDEKVYRVESVNKIVAAKGTSFVRAKLKDLSTGKLIDKHFTVGQEVTEVTLQERRLEFLYIEGTNYIFLDIDNLDMIQIERKVIKEKADFLKEGVQIKAIFYGDIIFSVELPQFLELIVVKVNTTKPKVSIASASKTAVVETGAQIAVPLFIETGDIIKIDTFTKEYIQRV